MRKTMSKEVTHTMVSIAKMVKNTEGLPVAEMLEPVTMIGNVTNEKAQKEITKSHGAGVTVFGVSAKTEVYEMAVEDFIKYATIKVVEQSSANVTE